MDFKLVDASANSSCLYVNDVKQRGRIWPVYETTELLMSRVEIGATPWTISASDISYFFFIESGSVEAASASTTRTLQAKQGLEIPEGVDFRLTNLAQEPSFLVMVAGRELLPGSFFNSFSNAYLNT